MVGGVPVSVGAIVGGVPVIVGVSVMVGVEVLGAGVLVRVFVMKGTRVKVGQAELCMRNPQPLSVPVCPFKLLSVIRSVHVPAVARPNKRERACEGW